MSGTILGFPFSGVVTGDNGSIAAEPGDGSVANGNARGTNAVDWQTARGAATNVASGSTSTISGGTSNSATALQSTVGGGGSNTASGNNSVVAGGNQNVASGTNAAIAGGSANAASGSFSWAPGGIQASTRSLYGMGGWSAGQFAAAGDAQSEEHVLRRQTVDATATRLTADNAVAGAANTINLANFSAIGGWLVVRARAAAGANLSATWFINLSATRDANAASTLIEGGGGTALTPTHSRGTGSAWRIDVTADTTNGGIAITVTGAAATTINWIARFSAAQVQTAS